ncbi:DUF1269 domain-containing protein [Rhabdochromatium marinum]|uniref:DUF1269 domain-containing protein n=1 Tax=Rhabdochromatium marinum TaxID=48729 RepID=UPI0019043C12|nr:DUF1269 domain-containing protein [Rhabdochromatium marinum]MBK1648063.1 hypothetical protein [Rhabdochromatium marinum]
MSDLIVMAFPEPALAFALRRALITMQQDYLLEMEDVVVVTKNAAGQVKLHQTINLTAMGALGGAAWGLLIGMLWLNPLLGAALGAGAGALFGTLSDIGLDDDWMKTLASRVAPGGAGLVVLVRKATTDKVLAGLHVFQGQGQILHTSLSKDQEAEWRQVIEGVAAPDA